MSKSLQYNLLFKVLRKSSHLSELVQDDAWRRRIIDMKYNLSKLDSHLYTYSKFVAGNIDRFDVKKPDVRAGGHSVSVHETWGDRNFICTTSSIDGVPLSIIDSVNGNSFTIAGDKVYNSGFVIFENEDAHAFQLLALGLMDMKQRVVEFSREMKVSDMKSNLFNDYQ